MSNAPRYGHRLHFGDDDSATPILHVDMDSFFAEVELLVDPRLRGQEIIVGGLSGRGVVCSATYGARARGVHAGMPMGQARRLCPQAAVVYSGHHIYSQYSARVMEVLDSVTPKVEQVSVDEAFLDVSGVRRLFGSPVQIAQLIRQRIRDEVGLPASVGIARNKSVAKIASSNAKPDGMLLIPDEVTVPFLHGLPVGAIWGVGGQTRKILEREGIDTVEQLAHASRERLVKLLGPASAYHLLEMAWGRDNRPVSGGRVEKSVSMERTFETNIHSRPLLEEFILGAAHQCAVRLRHGEMVCHSVGIKLRDGNFATITRSMKLNVATDLGKEIAQAATELLSKVEIPASGVRLLGVKADQLRDRGEGIAVPLTFDPRGEATERALDEVTKKFGRGSLRPATLLGGDDGSNRHG